MLPDHSRGCCGRRCPWAAEGETRRDLPPADMYRHVNAMIVVHLGGETQLPLARLRRPPLQHDTVERQQVRADGAVGIGSGAHVPPIHLGPDRPAGDRHG